MPALGKMGIRAASIASSATTICIQFADTQVMIELMEISLLKCVDVIQKYVTMIYNRNIFCERTSFMEKQRTKDEIDREYSHHAMMYGHISRVIKQNQELLEQHMAGLMKLNEEGSKLPPSSPLQAVQEPTAPESA
jgi:uncharacterized protein YllA (UPF0747 family)